MTLDRSQAPQPRPFDKLDLKQAEKRNLSNGIPVYTLHSDIQEVLKVELVFKTGVRYAKKDGVAGFCTSMMTEGTIHYSPQEISRYLAKYGAVLEASSGTERSSVILVTLTRYLDKLLPLLQQVITEASFPDAELERQKAVAKQRVQVNLEKTSYLAGKRYRKQLFGEDHPYAYFSTEESVEQVERQDVVAFYEENFKHCPFEVVVAGNEPENFFEMLEAGLGQLPVKPQVQPEGELDPLPAVSEPIFEDKEHAMQSSLRIGRITIPVDHPDYSGLVFMTEALGGYFGSRLMKNIREEKGYSYGISARYTSFHKLGMLSITADVIKEHREEAVEEIFKEIARMQDEPLSEEELEMVRNHILGSFCSSINTPFDLAEKFKLLLYRDLDYSFYDNYLKAIRDMTAEKVQEMAKKYWVKEELQVVVVG